MKKIAIVMLLPLLTGCGIPPAITIASYALDGGLLLATGKTTKDHALSAAMQQDCNLFRVVSGTPVCQDYEPTARAAWALQTMEPNEEYLTTVPDGRVIRVAADVQENLDAPVVATTAGQRPVTPNADAGRDER